MATRKSTKTPARATIAPRPAPLAKLTRPRLYRVSPRERLFRLLDERREHPALWITGAPGAGKSALLASYLDARRLEALWYNVDAADRDPATFFYFLGLPPRSSAVRRRRRSRSSPTSTDATSSASAVAGSGSSLRGCPLAPSSSSTTCTRPKAAPKRARRCWRRSRSA
jgi:hypothetical protein